MHDPAVQLDALSWDAPVGAALFDRQLRCARINRALARAGGAPAGDLAGRSASEVLPAWPELPAALSRVGETGAPEALELREASAGRSPHAWAASVFATRGSDGAVAGVGIVAVDVGPDRRAPRDGEVVDRLLDERRRSDEALRESEQRLRGILNGAPLGIVEVNDDDRFVVVNDRFCEMLGYERQEILGRSLLEITAPEDRGRTLELNARVHEGSLDTFGYDKRYLRRDGSPLWVHVTVSAIRDRDGRFVRAIATVEDISVRKAAEEARARLLRTEATLRRLYDSGIIGVIYWTVDGRITGANERFLRMVGYTREDLLAGRIDWARMTPPEYELLDRFALEQLRSTGVDTPYEKEYVRKDGSRVAVFVGAAMLDDSQNDGIAYVVDLSDRKRAVQALQEANERLVEADRRKDEFLGMLSHELRNPLAPIRNALYILDRADPVGPQARRAREVASRQVAHLTRLVDDLLDVTRIARGKIELRRAELDLGELVRRTGEDHRALMHERGLLLAVEAPREPVRVTGDETRIAQVLGNLLQNAAKFTAAGGRVTLSLAARDGAAEVRVRDTGAGIEPELLARVFEPFIQAEQTIARTEGGLGLGLALVKGLVELHGGKVTASSEGRGRGTEFAVTFPLLAAADAAQQASAPLRAAAGRTGHRVLVVDDNRDAAESLAELVQMFGHEVEVALDGPSAIAKARERRPHVVLCDIGLPGMSGYDVARALRADAAGDAYLVAVSGYAQPEDVRRAVEAGFDDHIAKPADPAVIERLLA